MIESGSVPRTPELISVIVPVRNCERHIGDQMAALAAQAYAGAWELLVVDNGCSDRSIAIARAWRDRLPRLEVVDARDRRGLNRARNAGVAAARGDFVAFCDADDAVAPAWLAAMADGATRADIVGGEIELAELNDAVSQAWERAEPLRALPRSGPVPYPPGGNCGVWAHVARELGWDESFGYGGADMEFGWRASLAGFRVEFVPEAVIRLRYRATLGELVRQHFRYGVAEPHLFRRFRAHGMPRSSTGEALAEWRWIGRNANRLAAGRAERGHWMRVAALRCGRLCGSARWRVLYL